jgi:hypothetical protein
MHLQVLAQGGPLPPPSTLENFFFFFEIKNKFLKDISYIYANVFQITQNLSMIGALGTLKILCQAPSPDHTQNTSKKILVFHKINITIMPHATTN